MAAPIQTTGEHIKRAIEDWVDVGFPLADSAELVLRASVELLSQVVGVQETRRIILDIEKSIAASEPRRH